MSLCPPPGTVKYITVDSSEEEKMLAKQQDEESSVRIEERKARGEKVPTAKKRKLDKDEERKAKKKAKLNAKWNQAKEIANKYIKFHRDLTEEEEKEAKEEWEDMRYDFEFSLHEMYILAVYQVLAKDEREETDDEDE